MPSVRPRGPTQQAPDGATLGGFVHLQAPVAPIGRCNSQFHQRSKRPSVCNESPTTFEQPRNVGSTTQFLRECFQSIIGATDMRQGLRVGSTGNSEGRKRGGRAAAATQKARRLCTAADEKRRLSHQRRPDTCKWLYAKKWLWRLSVKRCPLSKTKHSGFSGITRCSTVDRQRMPFDGPPRPGALPISAF